MIRPVFGDAGYRTDESLGQSAGCSANLYPYYPGHGLQGHYATAEPWGGDCKAMPSTVTRLQALASPRIPALGWPVGRGPQQSGSFLLPCWEHCVLTCSRLRAGCEGWSSDGGVVSKASSGPPEIICPALGGKVSLRTGPTPPTDLA